MARPAPKVTPSAPRATAAAIVAERVGCAKRVAQPQAHRPRQRQAAQQPPGVTAPTGGRRAADRDRVDGP
jgi:hypothetical protein